MLHHNDESPAPVPTVEASHHGLAPGAAGDVLRLVDEVFVFFWFPPKFSCVWLQVFVLFPSLERVNTDLHTSPGVDVIEGDFR